ncbi:L,D-transpeptidase family protein [Rubritalea sp.]|uniref:L,D-transpeptidase family protein n=1 Tax=Rubritalea sp. TaxID=2109375 RepID=UPI003EFA5A18
MPSQSAFNIKHSTFEGNIQRILLAFTLLLLPATAWEIPKNCDQLIVGTAKSWDSSYVSVTLYERTRSGWKAATKPVTGRLGKNGLAWGRGIHPFTTSPHLKKEGDGRAPAGVFQIGGAYGVHKSIKKHRSLPYRRVTTRDLWVEDSTSSMYNRHILLDHEPSSEWEKKAQMRQNDYPHSLKLYIGHNTAYANQAAKPNGGSAIFFHIWRNGGASATAGCTTLPEANLRDLISKIDPSKNPLYLLLPQAEYVKLRAEWKLP